MNYGAIAILCVGALLLIVRPLSTCFDRWHWTRGSVPHPDAYIEAMDHREVNLGALGKRLKTTVSFSDGFCFVTFKSGTDMSTRSAEATSRRNSYYLYLDDAAKERIRAKATAKHAAAVGRRGNGNGQSIPDDSWSKPGFAAVPGEEICHYGKLEEPREQGNTVKWTYRIGRYDADFVRACAQAIRDQFPETVSVFRVEGNGVQRDHVDDLVQSGQKITEHAAFWGDLKRLKIVVWDRRRMMTASFAAGTDTVLVETDRTVTAEELARVLDRAVRQVNAL